MEFLEEKSFFLILICTGLLFLMVTCVARRRAPKTDFRVDVAVFIAFVGIGLLGVFVPEHGWAKWLAKGLTVLVVLVWLRFGNLPRYLLTQSQQ